MKLILQIILFTQMLRTSVIADNEDFNKEVREACGKHGACFCTDSSKKTFGVKVDCKNRNLTDIPTKIPLNTTNLHLEQNSITAIRFVDFQGLETLYRLLIDDNEISSIEEGALDSCKSLETLSISHNAIQRIPEGLLSHSSKLKTIDLSHNKLKDTPELFLQNLTEVKVIKLSYNLLEEIPSKLFYGLNKLEKLYLSFNKLQTIAEDALWSLHGLNIFDISRNRLQELPNYIFANTSHLNMIDLSKNNLSLLHEDAFATTTAHTVNISSNSLKHIPAKLFGNKSSLHSLDLCCNQLQYLSNEIFSSTHALVSVRLNSNQLRRLPASLFSSTPKLKYLRISQNKLEAIPRNFFSSVPKLELLDICSNKLTVLPEDLFSKNINIQIIKLTENMLEDIPPAIFATATNLRTLYLKRNMLRQVHEDLFKFNHNITTLWLSWNSLEEIPEKLFANMSRVYKIDLSNNLIKGIPDQLFRKTRRLQNIDLSNNQLKAIPPNIFSFTPYLHNLQLDRNGLTHLPEILFASTFNLVYIDLGNNSLSRTSPDLFGKTSKLRVLKMAHNEFKVLPDGLLTTTPSLTTFNMAYNNLQRLPSNIFQMTPLLSFVDLSNNEIEEVPSNLFNTTVKLSSLLLHNNNISELPDNLFKNTPLLKNLDFSLNRLDSLSKGRVKGLTTVSTLSAAGNKIKVVSADVFSQVSLSNKLDISHNQLRAIPDGLFMSSKVTHKLRILFLQRNSIEYISRKAFAGLYFVQYILLYSNNIHTLFDGAFLDTSVKAVYLFGNNLSEIVGNPFDNRNISELHLYGNKIKTVSEETILGLQTNTTDIYMDCAELSTTPWAPKHVNIICVSPAFVPTINISLASVPTALRNQGFNCTINKRSDSQCEPCRPGTFGDGTIGCYPCPAGGYYQDAIGQAASVRRGMACKDCNIGTFVKDDGAISIRECLVCPEGTNQTTKAGFRACYCKQNYTRTQRFGPCELCTEEGINCVFQEYQSLLPGYYWNWTFEKANLTHYVQFAENLQDESRFYNEHVNYSGQIPKVFKCERPANCRNNGNTTLQMIEGICETGYKGWMCSKCKPGYYSVLNSCIPCPGRVWMIIEPIAVIALCSLFYLIILWQYQNDKKATKNERSIMDVIVSRLKIVLGFYQVIGEFFTSLHDVNWTGILQVIGEAISTVELTVLRVLVRPQCYNPRLEINPKIEFIFGMSLPLLIFVGAMSFFHAKRCYIFYKRRKGTQINSESHLNKIKEKLFTVVLVLLFVSYPPICSVTFQLYPRACKKFCLDRNDEVCIKRLRSDYDIACEELYLYHWLAYIATAIYVVPLPLILLILLRKHCYIKNHAGVYTNDAMETVYETSSSENSPLLQPETSARPTRTIPAWLLFLCENYKPQFWYWEIIELSRKVSQTLLITLFGWEDKLTVLITIGTSVLFLTMHARFWPMKDLFDQRLQMFSLTAIFINVLVAAMQVPESYEGTISIILVLLNIVVILIIAVQVFLGFILHVRKINLVQRLVCKVKKLWLRCMQRKK